MLSPFDRLYALFFGRKQDRADGKAKAPSVLAAMVYRPAYRGVGKGEDAQHWPIARFGGGDDETYGKRAVLAVRFIRSVFQRGVVESNGEVTKVVGPVRLHHHLAMIRPVRQQEFERKFRSRPGPPVPT